MMLNSKNVNLTITPHVSSQQWRSQDIFNQDTKAWTKMVCVFEPESLKKEVIERERTGEAILTMSQNQNYKCYKYRLTYEAAVEN